jgi:hypothetical protein
MHKHDRQRHDGSPQPGRTDSDPRTFRTQYQPIADTAFTAQRMICSVASGRRPRQQGGEDGAGLARVEGLAADAGVEQLIAGLRRKLAGETKQPSPLVTMPDLGYRLLVC